MPATRPDECQHGSLFDRHPHNAALREHDVRVPEDISVVGFDDVPEAACMFSPLTAIRRDFAARGGLIMQKMLVAVESSRTRRPKTLPCQPS